VQQLVDVDLKSLEDAAERAGVPWTSPESRGSRLTVDGPALRGSGLGVDLSSAEDLGRLGA
jgi:hypothetical protein